MNSRAMTGTLILLCLCFSHRLTAQLPSAGTDISPRELPEKLAVSLRSVKGYTYGDDREALYTIDVLVQTALNNPDLLPATEKQFIKFLASDISPAAAQFICRKLSLVGSRASAGVLARLLQQPGTAEFSLYALERIEAPAMDRVMLKALPDAEGSIKSGIISTLGIRECRAAVDVLIPLIYDDDPHTAQAALTALGRIGSSRARAALSDAVLSRTGTLRIEAMKQLLAAADRLAEAGRTAEALRIYKSFCIPDNIRTAALNGIFEADPAMTAETIIQVLEGNDKSLKSAALRRLGINPPAGNLQSIAALLPRLETDNQIELITALAAAGDASVLPEVLPAVVSENREVRLAAVTALGALGDNAAVAMLAEIAAGGTDESGPARESLYRLSGDGTDRTILYLLDTSEDAVLAELLRSISRRRMYGAAAAVVPFLDHTDGRVTLEAVRTLGEIAPPSYITPLLETLITAKNATIRKACENSAVAAARRKESTDSPAAEAVAAFSRTDNSAARASLLRVMGELGDSKVLPVIIRALDDTDIDVKKGAVEALTAWPDSGPRKHLQRVAASHPESSTGILALRGCIALIRKDSAVSDAEKAALYTSIWNLTRQRSEKLLVLSALSETAAPKSLELAAAALDDPELQTEAQIAAIRISRNILNDHPAPAKKVLLLLKEKAADEKIREQAETLLKQIK